MCRFIEVDFGQITSNVRMVGELIKIRAKLLYSSKYSKKHHLKYPAKDQLPAYTKEVKFYDRFLVFGVPGTANAMGMFTHTIWQSNDMLRFSCYICPGDDVWIVMPRVSSFLAPQTPEIFTKEPLVPCCDTYETVAHILPPADVLNENYQHFDFVTNTLTVAASIQENVCTGSFCDGQTETSSCACLIASPESHWLVTLNLLCDELEANTRGAIDFCSERTSKTLVGDETLSLPASHDDVDALDLHDSVRSNKRFLVEFETYGKFSGVTISRGCQQTSGI